MNTKREVGCRMSKKCIVSFGKGHNFKKGLERLEKNVKKILGIPFFAFTEYPEGCPTHEESPFAFKFYCIEECRKNGYDIIFWADSSVIIKNNLQDIFDALQKEGYFFIRNHHSVGDYCHDRALDTLNITREQSFNTPCLQGTQLGLNLNFKRSKDFLDEVIELANDGITFPGPYTNKNNIASVDSRVHGHRHDQVAMSVVALNLKMNNWWPYEEHKWFIHDREYVKDCASTVTDIPMSYFNIRTFCQDHLKYRWDEDEIITGDNIKQLGDYVFDVDNFITGDHGRPKLQTTKTELALKYINEINEQQPRVIYVYGHDIDIFLEYVEKINFKFDLITHNSDIGIDKKHFPYSKKIKNWYGQNNHIGNNAVTLPIGIARKKYDHGNTKLLSKLSENSFKDILVYKNFSIDTNAEDRLKVDEITTKNGIKMSPCTLQEDYLNYISRSVFCISPPGNGIDCHRIWECLYLKCIPIVKYHHAFEQFKDLPILFIEDWNDVTTKFLKTKLSLITKLDEKHDMLKITYFKSVIKK